MLPSKRLLKVVPPVEGCALNCSLVGKVMLVARPLGRRVLDVTHLPNILFLFE